MLPYLNNQKTCIVIGNGPSLYAVPDIFLEHYPTFGTNRIYLRFVPTFYVAINSLVIQQNQDEIAALDCHKFIRTGAELKGNLLKSDTKEMFSFEPLKWVNEGYTVTYVCLQLAYWLGFETALLVGVDHRYIFDGKPNAIQTMNGDDPNHFDPAYFRGQKWQTPDLMQSERYYKAAREIFEKDRRRIINLTKGSVLNVFEKGNLAEWM